MSVTYREISAAEREAQRMEMLRQTVKRLAVAVEFDHGRWLASVESMPGVMAYGDDLAQAKKFVRLLALRVLVGKLKHGDSFPSEIEGDENGRRAHGDLLRAERQSAGVTMGDVARLANVSVAHVSAAERGISDHVAIVNLRTTLREWAR